jgi:cytochrome c
MLLRLGSAAQARAHRPEFVPEKGKHMTNRSRHLPAAVLGAALLLFQAGTALAEEGDPAKGKQVFAKCQVCHSIEAGVNKIGPSLHGVYGRKAGTLAGYNYTDAMKNSGFTWDEASLNTYLTNPRKVVPGTRMVFVGLPKEQDRLNVIAYLKQAGGTAP